MREFGSPPHPNRACEHVCSVLGPLSRKVTLGGRPLVPFSRRICLSFFFFNPLHTHLTSSVFPSSPSKFPAAPRRVGSRSRSRGGCGAWHTPAARTAASPWQFRAGAGDEPRLGHCGAPARAGPSSARPEAALPALRLPALGWPWLGCPEGLRKLLRHPEHRKQNPHLIRRGAGALRGRGAACPRSSPTPPPPVLRQPLGVTEQPPPHPPADKGPGQTRRPASLRSGRRRRRRRRRWRWIAQKEARARPGSAVWGRAARCA